MLSLGDWKLGTTAFSLTLGKTEWFWVLGTSGSRDLSSLVLNEVTLPQTDIVCILDILLNSRLLFKEGLYAVFCWVPFVTISWIMTHWSQSLIHWLPPKYYCHVLYIRLPLKCASKCNSRCWWLIKTYMARDQGIWGIAPPVISTCPIRSGGEACYGYCLLSSDRKKPFFYLGIHPLKCHSPEFRLPPLLYWPFWKP